MIVLSGALVLVALVLLVFGALDRNLPYVYASIGVSVLSLLLLVVGILQRRGELDADEQEGATAVTGASAERVPALVGAEQAGPEVEERTAEPVRPAPAPVAQERPAARHGSRRVQPVAEPVEGEDDLQDVVVEGHDEDDDEDGELVETPDEQDADLVDHGPGVTEPDEDGELVDHGSGVTVLVVSGRPRYHLEGCRVLRGKEPQPLDRDDAREHGFSPCGVCKPDADETTTAAQEAEPDRQGEAFTEALFGGPLSADGSSADGSSADSSSADGDRTGELDEPVQPVVADVEPEEQSAPGDGPTSAGADGPDEAPELPAELRGEDAAAGGLEPRAQLHGDDPADDPEVELEDAPVTEPAPDVAANPDELPDGAEPDLGPAPERDVEVTQPVQVPALLEAEGVPVEAPAADVPAAEVPAEPAAAEAPVKATRSPEKQAPEKQAPEKHAPKKRAPQKEKAPARRAPAAKTPGTKTPATKAPATKTQATKTPATKTPATSSAPAAAPVAPKRPLVRAVRADALRLGAPSTGVTTTRVAARAASPAAAAPVVVVPDRDRFHRPECRFVRDVAGATTLLKTAATRQGYAPCGVCKP